MQRRSFGKSWYPMQAAPRRRYALRFMRLTHSDSGLIIHTKSGWTRFRGNAARSPRSERSGHGQKKN